MRRFLPSVAIVVGCLLLFVGAAAGVVNRQVLDGARFAEHADAVRTDPDVSAAVGRAITTRVLQLDPDLIAVRPLVESLAISLARSPALRPIVLRAAQQLHTSLTSPDSGSFVLRLIDVGAVLTASLRTVAPSLAQPLPDDFDVTLARIGSGSFADRTVRFTHWVSLLAWLLPLCAFVLIGLGVGFSRNRWVAGRRAGLAVLLAGAGLGVVAVCLGIAAGSVSSDAPLRSLLLASAWYQLDGPTWWTAGALIAAGAVAMLACARLEPAEGKDRTWRAILTPTTTGGLLVRAGVLAVSGIGLILRPELALRLIAGAAGLGLVVLAFLDVLAARTRGGRVSVPRPRLLGFALLPCLVVLLVAFSYNAGPVDERVTTVESAPNACNGHVELCNRPYDEVAFPATHNSMTAADEDWFLPEQPDGIVPQLDKGIRVFLIDSWYGQATSRPGVIATAEGSRPAAQAELNAELGPDVVAAALRVRQAASLTPTGVVRPYLCHGLCELGSVLWETQMTEVRQWMAAHPRDVVTFFIQDEVTPADTNTVFKNAGLLPFVHAQAEGQPWPTLGQLIDSGQRIVVFMENHGGGAVYPWLMQGFDFVQDTPYDTPNKAAFSCRLQRGSPDDSILLVNHWVSGFNTLVSTARRVNERSVLLRQLRDCEQERGQLPNFVAVNFYNLGDLFPVVDELNGVHD